MPNLKEVRNRIVSVSSTQQITSAMKMVSAAKLKRAQDAIIKMRPYASKLREVLENLSAGLDASDSAYSKQTEAKNVLLVVITSNRGLAGAFNANIIKKANQTIKYQYKNAQVDVLCIGKKGFDFYKKTDRKFFADDYTGSNNSLFDKLNYNSVAPLAEAVMQAFLSGKYDKVDIVYNQFKNAAVQHASTEPFLPVSPNTTSSSKTKKMEYIFEPNKEEIIKDLIPLSLKTQFYKALLDSSASEHGARMTAMHKATDNAKDLIKQLKLTYNKARQANITKEILEIVGGAEALNG
ncbi:MAG: ATP synthase F1 subunit gamma [Bacteroidetes bacterium]|nr:ATP synthase F1 subunit gamma [Bacteroidota bacterium]